MVISLYSADWPFAIFKVLADEHPPVFVGLKVCAALLWLIFGAQCLQRLAQRNSPEP